MLDNPSPEKVNEIVNIAMQTPPFVAALTNETASYANYEKTLIDLEGNVPIYYIVRDEWANVVKSWRKKKYSFSTADIDGTTPYVLGTP